jgi:enoyl-CoA hydratase/carnithine racemase
MAINEGYSMPLDEALEHEAQLFAQAADTQDRREGAAAFLERRQPEWTGT